MTGIIPQSAALAEATPESFAEVMSRNVEEFRPGDVAGVVAWLRQLRERWEAAEATKATRPKKASGGTTAIPVPTSTTTAASPEELGF